MKKLRLFLLIPLFAFTLNLAHAQDATDEPTLEPTAAPTAEATLQPPVDPPPPEASPLPDQTESPEDILRIVWAALIGGAATVGGSLFVTTLTSLGKMFLPDVPGATIKNVLSVVTWIVYGLAVRFGFGTQAQGIATVLTPILVAALPLIGTLIGSVKVYKHAVETNTPFWGFQRTDPLATVVKLE